MKKKAILLVLLCSLLFTACKSEEAKQVDKLIDNIGEVTLKSSDAINAAEESFEALSSENKEQVDNHRVLIDAREKYDFLVNDKTASDIEEKIDSVKTDSTADYSHFISIKTRFDNSSDDVKKLVDNADKIQTLEASFNKLFANELIVQIDAIGTVTLDSENSIKNCRNQYNSLSADSKKLVTNLQVLTDAETTYNALMEQAEQAALNNSLSRVKINHGKVNQVTWYEPNIMPNYANTRSYVLPYIGKFKNDNVLHIVYHYTDDDWIFYDNIVFLIDGERSTKNFSYGDVRRDHGSGDVWERADTSGSNAPKSDIARLWKIANSTETIIRFQGDGHHYDLTVSAADKQAIKDVLTIYEIWEKE